MSVNDEQHEKLIYLHEKVYHNSKKILHYKGRWEQSRI